MHRSWRLLLILALLSLPRCRLHAVAERNDVEPRAACRDEVHDLGARLRSPTEQACCSDQNSGGPWRLLITFLLNSKPPGDDLELIVLQRQVVVLGHREEVCCLINLAEGLP